MNVAATLQLTQIEKYTTPITLGQLSESTNKSNDKGVASTDNSIIEVNSDDKRIENNHKKKILNTCPDFFTVNIKQDKLTEAEMAYVAALSLNQSDDINDEVMMKPEGIAPQNYTSIDSTSIGKRKSS